MTDAFNEPVQQDTIRLRALLQGVVGVSEVEKARGWVAQDETREMPNLLTFRFHEVQFFARARTIPVRDTHPKTEFVFLRPGNHSDRDAEIGVIEEGCFAREAVQTLLGTHVTPAVVITGDGDALHGDAHLRGDTQLAKLTYLTHTTCKGAVDIKQTTPRLRALHCRACGLRVVVPLTVVTINDLRSHFAPFQPAFRDAVSQERGQAELRASGG